jgi:divalent metal cation (Fe/Co/Zn/Cd) transporter
LTVAAGHQIAKQVHQRLLEALPYLAGAIIHVDPLGESGERHHHAAAHQHDGSIEAQAHGSGARP